MSGSTRLFTYIFNCPRIYNSPLISKKLVRCLSSRDVGIVKSSPNTDILLQNLKNANSSRNILQLVADHRKIMNNQHLMQALRSLFMMQKSGNSGLTTHELLTDQNFKSLCLTLKSQARSIDLNDTVEAVKVVSYVGVPSDSTIMQVLLQLIRYNVNSLSLQHIIFLDYILKQFQSTPLSDALLIAFPIVFEANLPLKMDKENLEHLADYLQFASRKRMSEGSVNLIIHDIMSHRNLDAKIAMSIIWSLCDIKPQQSFVPLLQRCINIVIKNVDNYKFNDLETTLTKLTYRINAYSFYYNEDFCNTVADITIDKDLGFQQALWIQQKFNKIGHSHRGLIDYLAFKIQADDKLLLTTSRHNLYNVIQSFTNTEYKPKLDSAKIQNCIEGNANVELLKNDANLIKFAARLAVLDIFIPKIIEKSFQEENIASIGQNGSYEDCKYFLTLYQGIWSLQPDLRNLLPKFEDIKCVISRYQSINILDFPLQGALEKAFGGKQYILSNCATRQGLDIHHAIIMRKGGFPVALQNSEMKHPIILEEVVYPADSRIFAVFGLKASCYTLNNHELKGINSYITRILEASGYSVIVIPLEKWSRFVDHEKIPYLMRAIKDKSETLEQLYAEG